MGSESQQQEGKRRRSLKLSIHPLKWLGDALIVLSGGDRTALRRSGVDRGYFVGLGVALLMAAVVAATSVTVATSIGLRIQDHARLIGIFSIYFLLVFGLDRWLVHDPTAGFAAGTTTGLAKFMKWLGHVFTEAAKIAPRVVVAWIASSLFAEFILLLIFAPEIMEQRNVDFVVAQQAFQQRVSALEVTLKNNAQSTLNSAAKEKTTAAKDYKENANSLAKIQSQENAAIAQLAASGIRCTRDPVYYYSRRLGRYYLDHYQLNCPPQYNQTIDKFKVEEAKYIPTKDLATQLADIDKKYNVQQLAAFVSGKQVDPKHPLPTAHSMASQQLAAVAPNNEDGILARQRALSELTTKGSSICILPAATGTTSTPCASSYNSGAAFLRSNIRWWVLLLEILPVVFKFVRSICPRSGYSALMAARDSDERVEALAKEQISKMRADMIVGRTQRELHVANEAAALVEEKGLRELGRIRAQEHWQTCRLGWMLLSAKLLSKLRSPCLAYTGRRHRMIKSPLQKYS